MVSSRLRWLGVILLASSLLFAASGCGGGEKSTSTTAAPATTESTTSATGKQASDVTVGYIPIAIANPIIKAMSDGVKVKAEALGMKFQQFGGELGANPQIQAVKAAVAANVSALGIWPYDPKGLQGALDQARAKDIQLLIQGTTANAPNLSVLDFNDEEAAGEIATLVAKELKTQGKPCRIGIIQGLPVIPIMAARQKGYEAKAKAAGCEILDQQVNDKDTAAGARPIAQGWATKYGDKMTAILANNDPTALGAISARSGKFDPIVIGMNGDQQALDAIREGRLFATMAEPAVASGNAIAQLAYDKIVEGKSVPDHLWLKYTLVTKDTIDQYPSLDQQLSSPMDITWSQQGDRWIVDAKQG